MIERYKELNKGDLISYITKRSEEHGIIEGFGEQNGKLIFWIQTEGGVVAAVPYDDMACISVSHVTMN